MSNTFDDVNLLFKDRETWVLGRILDQQAHEYGDRPFLQWASDVPLTFDEVNRQANRLANGFTAAGVSKGDFVSIMLPNGMPFVLSMFGLMKIGAIPAPINTAFRGYFLELAVNTCGAQFAITNSEFLPTFAEVEDELPRLSRMFVVDDRNADTALSRISRAPFGELVSDDQSNPGIHVRYNEPALVQYTSGTTGPSKAVLLPHAQLHWFGEATRSMSRITETDVSLNAFPLFHGNPMTLTIYPCLIAGAKAVLYERFSASLWARRMRQHKVTHTTSLGVTMDWIFKQAPRDDDATNLRVLHANPTAHLIRREFQERFNVERVLEAFGQTETGPNILAPYDEERPPGAMGKLIGDWYEARIVDPASDEEVAEGESGELLVRPRVPWITCLGYFGNPEGTQRAMRNLWWHLGDRVRRDADGWFYFEDRTHDALRVGGENISSYEVEQLILSHPSIAMCAVIGVKSAVDGGEHEMKAVIVLQPDATFELADFIAFCECRLPFFAVPRYVKVAKALPLNDLGKIRKDILREQGLDDDTWDRLEAGVLLERERARLASRGVGGVDVIAEPGVR